VKINKQFRKILSSQKSLVFLFVGLFAVIGIGTLILSHADSGTATLSISPSSETVTKGSDITITLVVNPEGSSINTVQTVLSYPSANFSLVSAVVGSSFGSFINTPSTGSISITAASTTPVTGTSAVTVATITLASNTNGDNLAVSLAGVCPSGNYALTCSAAYDASTDNNDLGSVGGSASYSVNPLPPSAPTNFVSSAVTKSSTTLSWTASVDSGGTVSGYYLYRYVTSAGADSATKIATPSASATSYTDSSLAPGTDYSYYIEAFDTSSPVGVSSASSTVNVTTTALPTAPTNLAKSSSTTTSISLSWTASTDNGGPGLGGYYLYRYVTSSGAGTAAKIATPSASATSYTDTGLSSDIGYSYYLEAYDSASTPNISAASTTLSTDTAAVILPSSPSGLAKVSSSAYTLSLSWTASTDNGGPGVGGYYLFRNGTKIATITGSKTTYLDAGLSINTTYSYYLQAYDSASTPNVSASSATVGLATSSIIGDLDGDSVVTGHDLSILISNYGDDYVPGEFDGGTLVEGQDISILLTNYGK
jgi:hypothetical protein